MASPLTLSNYDIIICGGGTAGCVLASRLTEDPNLSVIILEAGENANDDPRISTPGLFPLLMDDPDRDWQSIAEASPGLNGRRMGFPRGKCLGGSSAVNLMALVYPSKAGMDAWADLGNPGWDWEGLAPYYRKFQRHCPPSREVEEALSMDFLDPEVQGTEGPICSSYPANLDPLHKAWVDTWKGLQRAITGDPLTGVHTDGYTSPTTVDPVKAERSHAGNAYFAPVAGRANLHVVTGALIEKVELDTSDPDSVIAKGVTFTYSDGHRYTAKASREVILSAGTIGSAAILERSGIGSKALCEELGVKNIIGNPNVGENLQDHLMCGISYEVKDGVATADSMRDPAVIQKAMQQYQASKSGPLAGGGGYSFAYTPLTDFLPSPSAKQDSDSLKALLDEHIPLTTSTPPHNKFIRSVLTSPVEASATLCFITVQFAGTKLHPKDIFSIIEPENFVTILPQLAHPFSRGSVHIASSNAGVSPRIEPRYFSHPLDVEVMARHLMQVEVLAASPPLSNFLKPRAEGGRRLPVGHDALTLDRARELARAASTSNYHPVGTCAMMRQELGGVVDSRLRVYGTKNLRVVDASVFPMQIRGNVQSSVYAVAEKGSDLVREGLKS